ncbi:hypothetical protein OESDEN_23657 [Oesophagostomum dentatum]|uniref:Serine-threonine/tyrosine-protein kinase catalytic domain-containing protein n=1 Tax=Oesophagostomum dentatum TaxID=61180 RepID=A0A0B1RUH4_OESDE|nr:hypothetical protein OESDEN_23657 [Oesophagostomum dentatum]
MRNVIDHDNLCKFLGLSLDGPLTLSVWRYCGRGSLKDVIAKGSLQMDWFFKYSLIRDICEKNLGRVLPTPLCWATRLD